MKKPSGDIIILEKCTKNQDHMLYCSMTDVIVIFHFGLFLPFYHRNSQKNQDLKKSEKKKPGDIIILPMCTKNYD